MATKQILFNADMVRAILAGRKTQTRRKVKGLDGCDPYMAEPACEAYETLEQWEFTYGGVLPLTCGGRYDAYRPVKAPYALGDILYVRETWCGWYLPDGKWRYCYKATDPEGNRAPIGLEYDDEWAVRPWRPSIHMPKAAARIFLRVTGLRAERLQSISEDDVVAEGAEPLIQCPFECRAVNPDGTTGDMCWNTPGYCARCDYVGKSRGELFGEIVWNRTIKTSALPRYGWDANPWVWMIEFERCDKPEEWAVKPPR